MSDDVGFCSTYVVGNERSMGSRLSIGNLGRLCPGHFFANTCCVVPSGLTTKVRFRTILRHPGIRQYCMEPNKRWVPPNLPVIPKTRRFPKQSFTICLALFWRRSGEQRKGSAGCIHAEDNPALVQLLHEILCRPIDSNTTSGSWYLPAQPAAELNWAVACTHPTRNVAR